MPTRLGTIKWELSRSGLYNSRGRLTGRVTGRAGVTGLGHDPGDLDRVIQPQQVGGAEGCRGHLGIAAVDEQLDLHLLAANEPVAVIGRDANAHLGPARGQRPPKRLLVTHPLDDLKPTGVYQRLDQFAAMASAV